MKKWIYSNKIEANNLKKVQIWSILRGVPQKTVTTKIVSWINNTTPEIIILEISIYNEYVRFTYYQKNPLTGAKEMFDYKVSLTQTKCYLGGSRYWFTCPSINNGLYCGKRVGVLYKYGKDFGCRHCLNLTYSSKNQGGIYKAIGKLLSKPDLEKMKSEIKIKRYKGKPTKRYLKFLLTEHLTHMKYLHLLGIIKNNMEIENKNND